MITISHDAFGRFEIVRCLIHTNKDCDWCGQNFRDRLFRYGISPDDNGRINWIKGDFCCKSCFDSYHG